MKNADMTVQCCVCSRFRSSDDWVAGQAPSRALVSHSYCPSCLKNEFTKVDEAMLELNKIRTHAA
ncbi:MAG: hypothetical protein ACI9X0_001390 [Kiritimatiellia bacterium]|jgi:hypothetical protein